MNERYTYAIKRQAGGVGEALQIATRDFDGSIEGAELPEPVIQRLEACARAKDARHEFLWHPDPAIQAQAVNRDRWVFERQAVAKPKAGATITKDPAAGATK